MKKFGGPGRKKKCCKTRKCINQLTPGQYNNSQSYHILRTSVHQSVYTSQHVMVEQTVQTIENKKVSFLIKAVVVHITNTIKTFHE